ncbi:MAG: DUF2332 domain-containing protein [Saprospiraceae bacterium]|nr:DUF2332 domain-containing protein [Saprospiraceae bacterium]
MKRTKQQLQVIFQNFAERECRGKSPLYYQLAQAVAQEPYLLELAKHARARQPAPNLFFGAVHYLLLLDSSQRLAQHYPSICKEVSKEIPLALFLDFCKKKEAEIIHLLRDRIVQTNAINRTAYLMPIASSIFEDSSDLNLIDIGCSSGLNLNFDQYQYHYKGHGIIGEGNVRISTDILEGTLPPFSAIVNVNQKIGIDQNPLDLEIAENANWLKALIWPDLLERFERMEAAIRLAKTSSLSLLKASQISDFREVIDSIPQAEPLLVYHTHVLYQFSKTERLAFRALIDEIGVKRDLLYLAVEGFSIFDEILPLPKGVQIVASQYHGGIKTVRHFGQTDGHATWIRWK